jgi:RNA polymerase sigma-70 factor (ECF subfamily)
MPLLAQNHRNNWPTCAYSYVGTDAPHSSVWPSAFRGGVRVVSDPDQDSSAANPPTPNAEPSARTLELLSLLGANERSLFAYVCALSPNWQDAEEIMQQVRIRIWQDFDQYDPAKPFGAWARAIAYYLTLAYRKERSRQPEFFSERILEEVSLTYEVVADTVNDRRTALVSCLEKIGSQKRRIIEEYYLSTEPSQQLADKLSLTPNALRQLLFRIRKTLFDCVERNVQRESHS